MLNTQEVQFISKFSDDEQAVGMPWCFSFNLHYLFLS